MQRLIGKTNTYVIVYITFFFSRQTFNLKMINGLSWEFGRPKNVGDRYWWGSGDMVLEKMYVNLFN